MTPDRWASARAALRAADPGMASRVSRWSEEFTLTDLLRVNRAERVQLADFV
jgi:hypothetical protein